MKKVSGFTLIELMVVMVILAVLAAFAVPKFIDMSSAAEEAATNGVASSLSSASRLNFVASVADNANIGDLTPVSITTCESNADLIEGGLPEGYVITAGEGTPLSGGGIANDKGTSECTVTGANGQEATFVGYGTNNV